VAKILFTSGSTGQPKGVINTHRMLASNQAQLRSVFRFLGDEPPVLCDWLPWNHTAGGNHNFGIALANGGTLYIDDGRPTPEGIGAMVRNLGDVAATAHFTVPRTYEALLPYLQADAAFRERFFRRLRIFFYAAAGMAQGQMDALQQIAIETVGQPLLWVSGLGATETAPFALCTADAGVTTGRIGWPVPGVELKLAPVEGKLEARVRGPNVTPGYWRDPARTAAAFDEEGYYRMGDAVGFVDPANRAMGLLFDGRFTEDFKLSTGTWVSVGPLRTRALVHLGSLARDVVIAAPDRAFVTALIFPDINACRALCPDWPPGTPAGKVLSDPRVRTAFRDRLISCAHEGTGASTILERALLIEEPPSIDGGELTDKGTLNQKAVLAGRSSRVAELYAEPPSKDVLVV
jgi:feruloyl-CoA synthase